MGNLLIERRNMGRNGSSYAQNPENEEKATKARGYNLRVHFKKTLEAANVLRGMKLRRAQTFLENVKLQKEIVPYRNHNDSSGRHGQAKAWKTSQGGWPKKSAEYLLDLLRNAEANAEKKALDLDALQITHIQVNQAPKTRRRTYRAHGRIGPYQNSPCHIELILEEEEGAVARPTGQAGLKKKKVSKKRQARQRQAYAEAVGLGDVD